MDNQFSVAQFFKSGEWEYVRRWVTSEEAIIAFKHYTNSVAAQMGIVTQVIITDGGDMCNADWRYGKGIVYPPRNNNE